MLDLIIFIVSEGIRADENVLLETIQSIENTIGITSYKYYLVLNKKQEAVIRNIDQSKILKVIRSNGSWASHFNMFFSEFKSSSKYILICHDDLIIRTSNFFETTLKLITSKEDEIGWVTYTSDFYYRELERPWSVSVRPGFFTDRENWPLLFECHNFQKSHDGKTKSNLHLIDMPESGKLVKSHAPYSNIALISNETMAKIGPCVDWTPYTMLIDEDWGLEALRNNLWNVWIPDVFYTHPSNYSDRTNKKTLGHRNESEAHSKFESKWGFPHGKDIPKHIEMIRKKYKGTLIPWSSYYTSYDWQYL